MAEGLGFEPRIVNSLKRNVGKPCNGVGTMSRQPTNRNSSFSDEAEGPGTSLVLVPGARPALDGPQPYEPLLLRPVEAARLLGIGRSKLFDMLARDELPLIRIGRCVRIPRRELARWVDQSLEAEIAVRDDFLGVRATTPPRY
jgi:excisionase family DNA binding protein